MLAQIRAFAKSPFATLLLAVLVVSFAVWGIRDVFNTGRFSDAVVKAGARPAIGEAQFKEIFNKAKEQQEQRAGQQLPLEEAVKLGMDRGLVDEMAASESFGALLAQEGVHPADDLVAGEIRKIPAFFNPISGQFDQQAYRQKLYEAHLTEAEAEGEFRDTIAQRQYITALSGGLRAPRVYALLNAAVEQEGRDFAWFEIPAGAVAQPAKPTDAALQAFLKENAANFTKPEMRQLSIVRFSAAQLALTLKAPEDEVKKRYEFQKDSLNTPEKRALIQIAVKDAKAGAEVAAKLKSGADAQVAAKAVGAQAVPLPATAKSAMPDRKVAEAAFALKTGDVAGPIQGDLGLVVIKLTDIAPAKTVSLEAARGKIEEKIKTDLAKEKVYEVVQKYEDARSGGGSMADAAKAAGASVITLPAAITKQGATLEGIHANMPAKVLQTAFTVPQGTESEVMDLGQGEYWVVKADKVIPPTLIGLDEKVRGQSMRDIVTRQVTLRELFKRLRDKADALNADIAKGKSLEAAAAEVKSKVVEAANVTRAAARPTQQQPKPAYTSDLLGRLFLAKPGDVVIGEATEPGLIIAKLKGVHEPAPGALASLADAQRGAVSKQLFEDLGASTRQAAIHKIKPTVDYKKARQALGLDPEAGPGGKSKP